MYSHLEVFMGFAKSCFIFLCGDPTVLTRVDHTREREEWWGENKDEMIGFPTIEIPFFFLQKISLWLTWVCFS